MKRSERWFKQQNEQRNSINISTMTTLLKSGPNVMADMPKKKTDDGKKFFVVGESEVGGEEVVS